MVGVGDSNLGYNLIPTRHQIKGGRGLIQQRTRHIFEVFRGYANKPYESACLTESLNHSGGATDDLLR